MAALSAMIRNKVQAPMQKRPKQPVEGLFCNYAHRSCMHNRLEGYEYCVKHILEEKTAPFKQCGYTSSKNGKKCTNAAPKSDRKDGHCAEHAKKAAVIRQKASRKRQNNESAESLLEELDHCKTSSFRNSVGGTSETRKMKGYSDNMAAKILEYATSSDSEDEPPLVDQAWRGDGDSDAESIDSDQEDLLKHAGVYTAEEVALIMRDKLIRLQSLYIDQFKRLQHIMKEKRRKYLHTYKQERDTLGPIKTYKTKVESRDKYTKLKALKRYHKRYGKEALLHRQSKERRIQVSEGVNYRPPFYPKCSHFESNQKCSQRALPLSKYCSQHILNDPHQVLYRPCQFAEGDCCKPVATIEDEAFCPIHAQLTDTEPRLGTKNEEREDDLDEDKGLFSKEAMELLLPHLEGLPPDFLLSQNPELPDSIFSTDLLDQASTSTKLPDHTKSSKYMDDQVIPSSSTNYKRSKDIRPTSSSSSSSSSYQASTIADDHKYGQTPLEQMPYVADLDDDEPSGPKPGPILLQHLQGNIDLSTMRSKQYYPASSVSSQNSTILGQRSSASVSINRTTSSFSSTSSIQGIISSSKVSGQSAAPSNTLTNQTSLLSSISSNQSLGSSNGSTNQRFTISTIPSNHSSVSLTSSNRTFIASSMDISSQLSDSQSVINSTTSSSSTTSLLINSRLTSSQTSLLGQRVTSSSGQSSNSTSTVSAASHQSVSETDSKGT